MRHANRWRRPSASVGSALAACTTRIRLFLLHRRSVVGRVRISNGVSRGEVASELGE